MAPAYSLPAEMEQSVAMTPALLPQEPTEEAKRRRMGPPRDLIAEARRLDGVPFMDGRSSEGEIVEVGNGKFFIPRGVADPRLGRVRRMRKYYNQVGLEELARSVGRDTVMVDANAGFGNDIIFWAVEAGAKKIYAFEGDAQEGELLEKNIKLNSLGEKVVWQPCAISDGEKILDIRERRLHSFFHRRKGENRDVPAKPLDDFGVFFTDDTIDLLRIGGWDVSEGTIDGAKNTLAKCKFVLVDNEGLERTGLATKMKEYGFTRVDFSGRGELYKNSSIQDA
ncbi:MAG: hypothetical protein LBH53_02790 [Puniceicoccales bacterium]|nr:hypothetical protein [Puniceicoccales bacterium]